MIVEKVLEKAIEKISDPFLIVLLVIIFFLFRMLMKRDDIIASLTSEVHNNGKLLGSLATLIEVLVYGRHHRGNNS